MKTSKHTPERSCVACGAKRTKADLERVVRSPQGEVRVDAAGRMGGRGAYLCARSECWEEALSPRRLGRIERALRGRLRPEDRAALESHGRALAEPEILG